MPNSPHSAPAAAPTPPAPETTFDSLHLHPDLLRGIHDLGFLHPTPIQAQAIPHIIAGRDVIGCAQTGTGKTAAFVLPILHRLMQHPARGHMRALIVAPTRELALQSMEHLRSLSRYVPLKGVAIFGGVPMEPQISALAKGVDIVSATPGRLLDHIYSGRIDFIDLQVFVLDEVDRMLDMGFLPDIGKIMRLLPAHRQNLMFSATLPPEILSLMHQFLKNPVTVQVGQRSTPVAKVRQALYPVPRSQKASLLIELLKSQHMTSVLVFTRTKNGASRLADTLREHGLRVSVMHGDRSQSQRLHALDQFKRGKSQIMVCTDIAARGIDIDDISHVVNYDVPHTPEDYVHRIGRTARAEATGDAFTLVTPDDGEQVAAIEKSLGRTLPRETLATFTYHAAEAAHGKPHGGRHGGPQHGRGGRPQHGHGGQRPSHKPAHGSQGQPARHRHGPESHHREGAK